MAFHPKENTGRVFKQDKSKDSQPDYAGTATVNGTVMRIVGWYNPPSERSSKATINMKFQDYEDHKREQAEYQHKKNPKTPASAPVETEDFDDGIPF